MQHFNQIVPAAEVVLIGGGHAHIQVIRTYGMLAQKPFRITLVSEFPTVTYSGMLPGLIAKHYTLDDCQIDLGHLCHRAGAKFSSMEFTIALIRTNHRSLSRSNPLRIKTSLHSSPKSPRKPYAYYKNVDISDPMMMTMTMTAKPKKTFSSKLHHHKPQRLKPPRCI